MVGDSSASRARVLEIWLGVVLFGGTAVVFWPVSRWLVTQTLLREQLHYALVVLAVAGLLVARRQWGRHRLQLSLTKAALVTLSCAYACVAAASVWKLGVLMLPASMLALAAIGIFVLGPGSTGLVAKIVAAFGAFVALVIIFPILDWPLRALAGVVAAKTLNLLGFSPALGLASADPPRLILVVSGRAFEVATECNGFGTISAATLLALVLAIGASGGSVWRFLFVPVAAVVGAMFNVLRILGICLLAPVFPDHYAVLHETAGVIALWSALAIVWWMTAKRTMPT